MDAKDNDDWREVALETVQKLSALIEDAQALLRRAEARVKILEKKTEDESD